MRREKNMVLAIITIAACIRLVSINAGDTLTDEVLISFRAIGMLDFDEAAEQTTPLEWYDPSAPSWTNLSFHDHPPLAFAIQHVFMNIFGENVFAFRLPSAILGILSVYLVYLIGRHLYDETSGLTAAALLAVTVNHVSISRLGLQEAYVIFFILLAMYLFLKAMEHKTYYYWLGIALGLALLTKYTAGILIPIFITYMLICRRADFRLPQIWLSAGIALLVFSPVIVYNIQLYNAAGHFDFQISHIVGQNPEIWSTAPGKAEFPTLSSRILAFVPNIIRFNSWLFLGLTAVPIIALLVLRVKKIFFENREIRELVKQHLILFTALFWILALILFFIGPSFRFLAMLTPFLALWIGAGLSLFFKQSRAQPVGAGTDKTWRIGIAALLFFELCYSANSQILAYPKGPELWAWSSARYENYNWGYHELDTWMREKTDGKMPALAFEQKYHFIEEIHKTALAKAERAGKKPYPALFVYDKNIQSIAQLWILDRLQIYHAWPIITADTYIEFLQNKGALYFSQAGFTEIYYIFPTDKVPWKKTHLTDTGIKLEESLTKGGLTPHTILENKRGDKTFRIYKMGV
jgi:predicted membrane-bound dolichyl-phosphate-mannose-protein mannosyltransferase